MKVDMLWNQKPKLSLKVFTDLIVLEIVFSLLWNIPFTNDIRWWWSTDTLESSYESLVATVGVSELHRPMKNLLEVMCWQLRGLFFIVHFSFSKYSYISLLVSTAWVLILFEYNSYVVGLASLKSYDTMQ